MNAHPADEGQHVDRKSLQIVLGARSDWPELAKDCVAFANSAGGRLGWYDICRSTDQRTGISSLTPRVAAGDTNLTCSYLQQLPILAPVYRTGQPYLTPLDPPPADPAVAHDPSTRPAWAPEPA